MAQQWSVPVTVIVAGQPVSMRAQRLRAFSVFVAQTLEAAATLGAIEPSAAVEWELRDADGHYIDPGVKVKDYGLLAGVTLYLNPRAGVGA